MSSVTTSIRLNTTLAKRLEKVAGRLSRGKNWIIAQALEEYLAKANRYDLAAEARRQSLACSRDEKRSKQRASWEIDISEWR